MAKKPIETTNGTKTKQEQFKQDLQTINRTGTVSGKASGVSNIDSSKIVKDTTNTSNLAGTNAKQNGTPKVTNTGSKPTGINTQAYNLAGSNNAKSSVGTVSTKQTSNTFIPSSTNPQTKIGEVSNYLGKQPGTISTRNDFATDNDYEKYLLDNKINVTKGDAREYITQKAREENMPTRQYIDVMHTRYKNANETAQTEAKYKNGELPNESITEINNQFGVLLDNNGNEVDAQKYQNDVELFNRTAEDINSEISKLEKDYKAGKIDYRTMEERYNRLKAMWDENMARGEELNSYQALNGFDYYDWAKQNGKDVTDFEQYVENFNDLLPERLAQLWASSWADTFNIVPQTYDLLATIVNPEHQENGVSKALSSTSEELREYAFAGADQFSTWSLQCVGALMPMINSMMVGAILPVENMSIKFPFNHVATGVEAFSDVAAGLQSANQTFRQRIEEGDDTVTALINAGLHGYITMAVEAMNAGEITNVLFGSGASKWLGGMALIQKASPQLIASTLLRLGVQEGAEENIETIADRIADELQNLVFGGLTGERVNVTELDPKEMATEFAMASVGAVLLGVPQSINVVVNSKKRYNAVMAAKAHMESVLNSEIAMPEERELALQSMNVLDTMAKPYEELSQMAMAVDLPSDMVEPMKSYDEMMNNLANALQPDIKADLERAQQTLDQANAIRDNLQSALLEKGINMSADNFIDMTPQQRAENLVVGKNLSQNGINNVFAELGNGQNGAIEGDTIYVNTNQGRTIDPDALADLDDNTFNSSYGNNKIFAEAGANPSAKTSAVHELIHFAENSGLWQQLRQYVEDTMGKERYNKAKARLEAIYKSRGMSLDADHELTAFYLQKNFGNVNFLEGLSSYNGSLFNRLVDNAKAFISGDESVKIENTLKRAVRQSINNSIKEADQLRKEGKSGYVGENYFTPVSAQMSIAEYDRTGRDILKGYLKDSGLSKKSQTELLDRMEEAYGAMKQFMETGDFPEFSKWQDTTYDIDKDGNFSVVISNGEYDMNLDFSTVCKKRKMMDKVLNELSRQGFLNTKLKPEQLTQMRQIIQEHGLEVACGLCFVDAKRFNQGAWAGKFETKWNGLIDQLAGLKDLDESQISTFGNGNYEASADLMNIDFNDPRYSSFVELSKGSTEEAKMAKALINDPELRAYVSTNSLYGSEGFEELKEYKPKLYDLVNISGGASKPKLAHTEVLYTNEVLNSANFKPEDAQKVGGVRIQSFSDFMTNMVFDYVQMFADMEAKGLTSHSYTKVKEYALLFGKTGVKINLSIIPAGFDSNVYTAEQIQDISKNDKALWKQLRANAGLDADGNYIFDKESFDWDLALEIQNLDGYDANVGTICVGVSDRHINKMLDDPDVCMIIPYHRSGINPAVAMKMGIGVFNDYTLKQNTRFRKSDGRPGTKVGKSFDFDFYNGFTTESGEHYKGLIENKYNAKKTANEYLRFCEDSGYIPKFDAFMGHPNYYKLLIDFRAYDKNGKVAPQKAIKISGDGLSMDSNYIDPTLNPALAKIYGDDIGFNNVLQKGLEVYEETEAYQNEQLDPIAQETVEKLGLKKQYSLGETDEFISPDITDYRSFAELPREWVEEFYDKYGGLIGESFETIDDFLNFAEPRYFEGEYADFFNDKLKDVATPIGETNSVKDIEKKLNETIKDSNLPMKFYNKFHSYVVSKGIEDPYRVTMFENGKPVGHTSFGDLDAALYDLAIKLSDYGYENYSVQDLNNENTAQYSVGETQNGLDNITSDLEISDEELPIRNVMPSSSRLNSVATVLSEAPAPKSPTDVKRRFKSLAKWFITDTNNGITDFADEVKNERIKDLADYAMTSRSRALAAIYDGIYDNEGKNKIGKSLVEAMGGIPKDVRNLFDEYMYHYRNIDDMSMRERLGDEFKDRPVFGDSVSADDSLQRVMEIEEQHPEFKQYAEDVWEYTRNLLKKQIGGIISQEDYDNFQKMRPHYVPISRNVDKTKGKSKTDPNSVILKFKGSSIDINPLDYALMQHTQRTFDSFDKNNLYREIVNAMGGGEEVTTDIMQNVTDEGFNSARKTDSGHELIAYVDGKQVAVPISEDMYRSISNKGVPSYVTKALEPLAKVNQARKALITSLNPFFGIRNAAKDIQDASFNTHYPKSFLKNYREAVSQIAHDGEIYQQFKRLGGTMSNYTAEDIGKAFEDMKNTSEMAKKVEKLLSLNDDIETAPRLAEFISSLEAGNTVEKALYDAAEVTTNFKRGGMGTKFADKYLGFTFLNASVQGFDKHMRESKGNLTKASANGIRGVISLLAKLTLASGLPLRLLQDWWWRKDKDYEELSDYIKNSYYIFWKTKDGKFLRINKGRIASFYQTVLMNGYKTLKGQVNAWDAMIDDATSFLDNIAPNNPLDNNIYAPLYQAFTNKTWYGDPIVSETLQKNHEEWEQYDEETDLLSKKIGELSKKVADATGTDIFQLSPKKVNYVLDQYSGIVGDVTLPAMTLKTDVETDNPLLKGVTSAFLNDFTTDPVLKNQKVTDFFALRDELNKKSGRSEENKLSAKYMNGVYSEMSKLYGEMHDIQGSDISNSQKMAETRRIKEQINALAREALNNYDQIDITGDYASVGGVQYYKGEDGWTKPSKNQLEKMGDLDNADKDAYMKTISDITSIRKDIKANTPEGKTANYTKETIDAINNSGLSAKGKNTLFDTYYSGKATDHINSMDLSEEQKYSLKIANKTAEGKKDENGKTISNSKAEATAEAYEKLGLLDDVLKYIKDNDISPSELGLSKTVYNKLTGKSNYSTAYSSSMSKKSSSSSKKSSSKVSKGSVSSAPKAKKGSVSMNKVSSAPNAKLDTQKLANNYLKAYSNTMSKSKASQTGSSVVCPRCRNRVTPYNGKCPVCGNNL